MHSNDRWLLGAMSLALVAVSVAQTNDIATGNMHFSAKDMDTNGDQMISKDEFIQYEQKLWGMMSKGNGTISVPDAASEFARGNLRFNAKSMDADHDGNISKEEFLAYGEKQFDKMKNKDGMMAIEDATKNFARGNR